MASTIKVNNIQNQCGANIINESANTITIGASGDTITLACGASQTGFGRTGTVDWDTTAKTASFTAVSGNGYFVNTTSGAITVTLPATPSAGDIVGFNDYARTFATNNLTVARNGSNIQGAAADGTFSTNGQSTMFVYVDGTQGWVPTEDQTTGNYGAQYITATGGTVTCCGDYKIHTFTGPGTFTVCSVGNPAGSDSVDYLVVAGGGSGGTNHAGGGGGGGFREGYNPGSYTASPLATSALPVTATGYPITVGGGAPGAPGPNCNGNRGSNSVFSTITSTGGGAGTGGGNPDNTPLGPGGSGGGAGRDFNTGGSGNTPPVSPPQGNSGGSTPPSDDTHSAGGGGAGALGGPGTTPDGCGGFGGGGNGATTLISGSSTTYAGGGGGGNFCGPSTNEGNGGAGGGGTGGRCGVGEAGTANTGGGGGGGGGNASLAGAGGSGIVIIRYKYQ